ncbi:AsnC family protein [Arthrobacter globiformis]|uniref:AsnC family protein n=1 Tax=Arthrobacter globiformis TaxID=1665 RepID=A0A328HGI5_ARTGO|nr:AsnC family protein [Arthrobacter globiformis]RAM37254.1 AsnC family protein [Arthrobacter globiformis]
MLFRGLTGRYEPDRMRPDYEVVPDSEIVGWRGHCSCGWQGDRWERVASPTAADFNRRRDYISADDSAHASLRVEDAIHNEWNAHVAPSEALLGLEAAARDYNRAGRRLAKTVAAAKATGASWADIGRAVGISRQSAHERWADKAAPLHVEEPQRRPPDGH